MKNFSDYWQYLIDDYKNAVGEIPPEWESHLRYTFCSGAIAFMELSNKIAADMRDTKKALSLVNNLVDEIKALSKS